MHFSFADTLSVVLVFANKNAAKFSLLFNLQCACFVGAAVGVRP